MTFVIIISAVQSMHDAGNCICIDSTNQDDVPLFSVPESDFINVTSASTIYHNFSDGHRKRIHCFAYDRLINIYKLMFMS